MSYSVTSQLVIPNLRQPTRGAQRPAATTTGVTYAHCQWYFNEILAASAATIGPILTGDLVYHRLPEKFTDLVLNGSVDGMRVANIHYGDYAGSWTTRTWDHSFERPFVAAQKYLLERGWYLYESTDPARGMKIHIFLSREAPRLHKQQILWHGHNVIPQPQEE